MSAPDTLERHLAESCAAVESYLDSALPPATAAPDVLHEAMRYAVFSKGKRLRPALAFGAAQACGRDAEVALPVAAAVELVHTYALVHDDLPAMDDDDERRGRPSLHVQFGEANAILAGDALLAQAFAELARAEVPPDVVARLARAAGSLELVGGQVDDLRLAAARVELADVVSIHRRKTAALFGFAVWGGGRLAGATAAALERLDAYATHYGLAFQAVDDLLDSRPGECSILLAAEPPAVRAAIAEHVSAALGALQPFGDAAADLRGLADAVDRRLP